MPYYYMENPPPLLGLIPRNEGLFIRSSSCLHCPLSTTVDNGGVDVLCGYQSALFALRTAAPMQVIKITAAGSSNEYQISYCRSGVDRRSMGRHCQSMIGSKLPMTAMQLSRIKQRHLHVLHSITLLCDDSLVSTIKQQWITQHCLS